MQISCSMIKHSDPKQLSNKRFLWITLPASSSSLREVGTGSQGRTLERGTEAETTDKCYLLACSVNETGHLSSPSLMLKALKIPGELLVFSLHWKPEETGSTAIERVLQQ